MTLNKAKGRMFKSVGWTWNPIVGCTHNCKYCWAKSLTERWGKTFEPQIRPRFFEDKMPDDGSWIFIGSMGDVFCKDVLDEWIGMLLTFIRDNDTNNKFLLQTKNPARFFDYIEALEQIKDKVILGTTIETTWDTPWSNAPPTHSRAHHLSWMKYKGFKTFLSLEPLSTFNQTGMHSWISTIRPEAVEIGLENYTSFLEKPPKQRILELLVFLREQNIPYVLKEGLQDYLTKGERI